MPQKKKHSEPEQQPEARDKRVNAVPWIAGVLFLLGLSVMAGVYWGRVATVKSLRFEGHHFVMQQELEQQVDIPLGVNPDSLDYQSIIGNVEKIPYVKDAEVRVEPSGDIVIRVTERKPLAMLADGESKIYVDEEGVKLSLVPGMAVDVPVLYGFRAKPMSDTLKGDGFRAVRDFLVEVSRNPVSDATISEVVWTKQDGVVALSNDNGVKLYFGKGDFKTRLRNWEAFYGEVVRQKGMQVMQSVDLRFQGQIVTRES